MVGGTKDENPIFLAPDDLEWNRTLSEDQLKARIAELTAGDTDAVIALYRRMPNADSFFWEYAAGGLRSYQYWNAHVGRLHFENRLDANPLRAARAYASYGGVAGALLGTMEQVLGLEFTPAVRDAWVAYYQPLAREMKAAAP